MREKRGTLRRSEGAWSRKEACAPEVRGVDELHEAAHTLPGPVVHAHALVQREAPVLRHELRHGQGRALAAAAAAEVASAAARARAASTIESDGWCGRGGCSGGRGGSQGGVEDAEGARGGEGTRGV